MPRSEPGLLVMCFYMVGPLGFEPRVLLVKSQMFLPLNYEPHMVPPVRVELSSNLSTGTIWGYNSTVEYPAFNRSIRVRFPVPLPLSEIHLLLSSSQLE